MAASSALNQQIVDSVSQSAVLTLGSSPTMAISLLYQAVAQAMGNAANNSTVLQQQGSTVTVAVASTACAIILAQKP
ncbi:MAG: Killing trait [Edaphobacter sp.]|jgi:hypothetical protein|nr:Killing trait [Edaphobacter sp.]